MDFIINEKDLEKTAATVEEIIKKIQKQEFVPTPSPEICGHCDFKDICEYRK